MCIFYSRYGICKFGPSCKFDHPMGIFTYNYSPTTADRHLLASSSSGNMTSQGIEGVSVNPRQITLTPSSDDNIDSDEWPPVIYNGFYNYYVVFKQFSATSFGFCWCTESIC